MDKMQFMLDNFKRAFPTRFARYEREWFAKEGEAVKSEFETRPLIDWSKPLVPVNSARQIKSVEFIECVWALKQNVYICKLRYQNYKDNDYEYYVMYDQYGCTLGKNAGTTNIKNKAETVTRHYAISKATGDVVATADSVYDANLVATGRGYTHDSLTFTSHTFTR